MNEDIAQPDDLSSLRDETFTASSPYLSPVALPSAPGFQRAKTKRLCFNTRVTVPLHHSGSRRSGPERENHPGRCPVSAACRAMTVYQQLNLYSWRAQ